MQKINGVAQNGRRVFLIGVRSDQTFEYEFPKPTDGPGTGKQYRSQRDAIERFLRWAEGGSKNDHFTGLLAAEAAE